MWKSGAAAFFLFLNVHSSAECIGASSTNQTSHLIKLLVEEMVKVDSKDSLFETFLAQLSSSSVSWRPFEMRARCNSHVSSSLIRIFNSDTLLFGVAGIF